MPGGRKRKCSTTNSAENHVSFVKRTRKNTQTTAKERARKRSRNVVDEITKTTEDSDECGETAFKLTPKRSVLTEFLY